MDSFMESAAKWLGVSVCALPICISYYTTVLYSFSQIICVMNADNDGCQELGDTAPLRKLLTWLAIGMLAMLK